MRYTQAEKMEIIRLVETSELSVKQTLAELEAALPPTLRCRRWHRWTGRCPSQRR